MLSGTKFLHRWAPQNGLVSTSASTKYDPSYLMTESPVSEKNIFEKTLDKSQCPEQHWFAL